MSVAPILCSSLAHIGLVLVDDVKTPAAYVVAIEKLAALSGVNARAYNQAYPRSQPMVGATKRAIFDAMMVIRRPNMQLAYEAVTRLAYNFGDHATEGERAVLAEVERVVGERFLAWFKSTA